MYSTPHQILLQTRTAPKTHSQLKTHKDVTQHLHTNLRQFYLPLSYLFPSFTIRTQCCLPYTTPLGEYDLGFGRKLRKYCILSKWSPT